MSIPFRSAIARCGLLLLVGASVHSSANSEILYDNLDNVRPYHEDSWLTPLGPDVKYAQQFFLGNQTSIDQVTVLLTRPQAGASGNVRFELWRDNGNGQPIPVDDPTGKIADLGTVLEIEKTVSVGEFSAFTLDNLVLGLEPNQPYWIVTDNSDVRRISSGERSVGIATPYGGDPRFPDPPGYDSAAGTNGAGPLRGYRNQNPYWNNLRDFFGLSHFYQAMRVEAMDVAEPETPLAGDFNGNIQLDAVDIDIITSSVRQALSDSQYDVDRSGTVSTDDRTHWVHTLANTYFGDANLDGEFNSSDLTTVFQAGEYEENVTLNSTWAEGDWNGDGDFDTGDLVLAFQDAGYEQEPRPVAAVPEPKGGTAVLLGVAAAIARRRRSHATWK